MQLYPGWSARDNYGLKKKRSSTGPHSMLNTSHKKAPRENNSMVNSPGHMNSNSPHRFAGGHHLMNSPHMNSTKNPMQLEGDYHRIGISTDSFCSFVDCLNQKKCRARFGLEGQSQWCKHCRRKKKCTRFLEDDLSAHHSNPMINNFHHSHPHPHGTSVSSHGNPSSLSSPTTHRSDNDDSMNDLDGDDILTRQVDAIEDDDDDDDDEGENDGDGVDDDDDHHDGDSDEENKQQHHQPVSLVYKPNSSKHDNHHSSIAAQQQQHQHQGPPLPPAPSSIPGIQQPLGHHFPIAPPPPAHLYQPSMIPSHFAAGFHY